MNAKMGPIHFFLRYLELIRPCREIMPKKPLRAAGAATLVAMNQDFTGTGTKTTISPGIAAYNENEIHFHLAFLGTDSPHAATTD
jgi:hypothetical protein